MAISRAGEASGDVTASVRQAAAINVSGGDVPLAGLTRAIYCGGAGNLVVICAGDSAPVTLVGIATGVWHPMQIQQINQSGTTATGIVVGY